MLILFRPPLNKKLFPVHRPSGLKRANWNSFSFFSYFPSPNFFYLVNMTLKMYILVYEKMNLGNKSLWSWPFLRPLGRQETIFYLRVALGTQKSLLFVKSNRQREVTGNLYMMPVYYREKWAPFHLIFSIPADLCVKNFFFFFSLIKNHFRVSPGLPKGGFQSCLVVTTEKRFSH